MTGGGMPTSFRSAFLRSPPASTSAFSATALLTSISETCHDRVSVVTGLRLGKMAVAYNVRDILFLQRCDFLVHHFGRNSVLEATFSDESLDSGLAV